MPIGIAANIASINNSADLYKNEKNAAEKVEKADNSAYNLQVSGGVNNADNVQYAGTEIVLSELRDVIKGKETELDVDFADDSKNFEKNMLLSKEGSYAASLGSANFQSVANLLM